MAPWGESESDNLREGKSFDKGERGDSMNRTNNDEEVVFYHPFWAAALEGPMPC